MDPRDLARYAFMTLVFGVVAIFGLKIWNKGKAEKLLITELRSLTSDVSMFEQFSKADAQATLLKSIHKINDAKGRFDLSPGQTIDQVFRIKEEGIMESTDSARPRDSPRQGLIRETLLRNHENATRLGFFNDSLSTDMLSRGEAPQINSGPATGRTVEVAFIIDPEAFPGCDKIIPNLILRPPTKEATLPDEFAIAQAKRLANLFQNCDLIERDTRDRIIEHYDKIGKEEEPVPEPEPEPEPEPATESPDPPSADE